MCNKIDSSLRDIKNKEECYFKTEIKMAEINTSYKGDYRILIYISLIIIGMKMINVSTYRNGIAGLMIIGWMIFTVTIIWIIFNISIKTSDERIYKYSGSERKVNYGIFIIILSIFLLSTCEIILLQFIGMILTVLGGYCIFEYIRSNRDSKEDNEVTVGNLIISEYGLKIAKYRNIEWHEIGMIIEFAVNEELYIGVVVDDEKNYRLVDKSIHNYLMKKFKFLRVIFDTDIYDVFKVKNKIITLSISQLGNEFEKCRSLMEYHCRNVRDAK